MPSTSAKQHRFMEAAAHNPAFAKRAGISTSVAREFVTADTGARIMKGQKIPYITTNPAGGGKTNHIASSKKGSVKGGNPFMKAASVSLKAKNPQDKAPLDSKNTGKAGSGTHRKITQSSKTTED